MKLLQHFKELTVRPKNAQELKGLILQLAIQGKLTANWRKENSDIEPASELLKRVRKERSKLIKEKKVRKGKTIQPIDTDEKYLEIPQNWVWTRLIEVGNIFNGNSVNKSVKAAKYEGLEEGLAYIGTKDVNYGFEALNYDNGVKIPLDEPKFKIAHKNTALICSEGGSAGKKCGITTEDICFGNKLYALEQYGDIEAVYILSTYKTPVFFEVFQSKMTGIIGGVSINSFGEIPIPLPPLEEQKEIVKVVETLFKEVEQLEQLTVERIKLKEDFVTSALSQLTTNNTKQEWAFLQDHIKNFFNETTNIKKLRETVLQLAVQGKLTADWRANNSDIEDASVLLKHIQIEKAQLIKNKKIKKEKLLPPITEDEIPYELPDGWVWCRMGEILNVKSSKRVFKSDYVKDGVPFFRSKEIGQLGRGQEVTTELFIEREKFEEFKNNFGVTKAGDILIACIGGSIGNTWLVDDREFYYKDGNLVQLDSIPEIDSFYLLKYLDSNVFYDSALGRVSGSAYKALTIEKIKNSLFPLPNEEEQKAIVEKVNALMDLCDSLELQVQQSHEHSAQLMQSCLREVFEN